MVQNNLNLFPCIFGGQKSEMGFPGMKPRPRQGLAELSRQQPSPCLFQLPALHSCIPWFHPFHLQSNNRASSKLSLLHLYILLLSVCSKYSSASLLQGPLRLRSELTWIIRIISHLKALNLSTSAKFLLPCKVTFRGSRD